MRINVCTINNKNYAFQSTEFNAMDWETYYDIAKVLIDEEKLTYEENIYCEVIDDTIHSNISGDIILITSYLMGIGGTVLNALMNPSNEEVA